MGQEGLGLSIDHQGSKSGVLARTQVCSHPTGTLASARRLLSTSTKKSSSDVQTPVESRVGFTHVNSTNTRQTGPGTKYPNLSWVKGVPGNSKYGLKPENSFIEEHQYSIVPKWLRSRPKLIHSFYYRGFFTSFVFSKEGVKKWMKGNFRKRDWVLSWLKEEPKPYCVAECYKCNKKGTVCICYYPQISASIRDDKDLMAAIPEWYANPKSMHAAYAAKLEKDKLAATAPKVYKVYLTASQKKELKKQKLKSKNKVEIPVIKPEESTSKSTDGLPSPEVGLTQNLCMVPVPACQPAKLVSREEKLGSPLYICPKARVRDVLRGDRTQGSIGVGFPIYINRFSLTYAACHARLHDLTHSYCKMIHIAIDSLSRNARSKALGLLQSSRVLWDPYTGLKGVKYAESPLGRPSLNVGVSSFVSMTVRQLSESL